MYAKPGAGKTVLAASLIDHMQHEQSPGEANVFYFFCNDSDIDRKTSLAVVKSLLYQLFQRSISDQDSLLHDLESAKNRSGQPKAGNFSNVWKVFSSNVGCLSGLTIIVDALDECEDPNLLIRNLKELSWKCNVKVLLTSGKERHFVEELDDVPFFEITTQDVGGDIEAFIEEKVAKSPRLSSALIREKVISKLSKGHEGMFLWADLMLKELKWCPTVDWMHETLNDLPKGLDTTYQRILQRLEMTLNRATLDLCHKVLMWVVSAFRPLSRQELREALSIHYQLRSNKILSSKEALLYSDKEMILFCGSLVTVRNDTIQLIHLSTKEFLQKTCVSGRVIVAPSLLLVDSLEASLQITLTCLICLSIYCKKPLVHLNSSAISVDLTVSQSMIEERKKTFPFTEYAVFCSLVHLTKCELTAYKEIAKTFRKTFESSCTLHWVEIYLKFDRRSLPRLHITLEALHEWTLGVKKATDDMDLSFMKSWSLSLIAVLDEYGTILILRPHELYFLDLSPILPKKVLESLYESYRRHPRNEMHHETKGYIHAFKSGPDVPRYRQLRSTRGSISPELGYFIYDESRNVVFSALRFPSSNDDKIIFVQEANTGRWISPVVDEDFPQGGAIVDAALNRDGKFLGIFCCDYGDNLSTTIWEINAQLHFTQRKKFSTWARRVVTQRVHMKKDLTYWWNHNKPNLLIAFGEKDCFYSPCGKIDPVTSTMEPVASSEIISGWENFCYIRNGRYLVVEMPGRSLIKVSTQEAIASERLPWLNEIIPGKAGIECVSNSGRYVVIYCGTSLTFALMDTLLVQTMIVPVSFNVHIHGLKERFCLLSADETRLFDFRHIWNSGMMSLVVWSISTHPVEILVRELNRQEIAVSLLTWGMRHFYMLSDEASGWLVMKDGTLEMIVWDHQEGESAEVRLPEKIYFDMASSVSSDARRLGIVSYDECSAQVQTLDITTSGRLLRLLKLDLTSPVGERPDISKRTIQFSPDLCLLVMGTQIFHIGHHDDHVASEPISIQPLIPSPQKNMSFAFSSCNKFLMCIFTRSNNSNDRNDQCRLIYIDLDIRSASYLETPILERSVNISVDFHPFLPLMITIYKHKGTASAEETSMSFFDLENSNAMSVVTPIITKEQGSWR